MAFADMAPQAHLFVYATWGRADAAAWDRMFDGPDTNANQHQAGFDWLMSQLAINGYDATLINAGKAFEDAGGGSDLYRDHIHASNLGKQLAATTMANTLRATLIPEPSSLAVLSAAIGLIGLRRRA